METRLNFDRQGLLPVVIVDDTSNDVLMVAFMNEEALQLTRETGYSHFFSRSRNKIWRKGEQSGNVQEVREIFVNCEESSLLIRVNQQGGAACHTGHRSCYYRRLRSDGTYEEIAEQVFDPAEVYGESQKKETIMQAGSLSQEEERSRLDTTMRKLYTAYLYLRDNDLSEVSNTSRLLHKRNIVYLLKRLKDELQELFDVQTGKHMHKGRQPDTILEGSQVGYWLFLLAASSHLVYEDFMPHASVLSGYYDDQQEEQNIQEKMQDCIGMFSADEPELIIQGLHAGFSLVGWASRVAQISPLAPGERDLEQMLQKGYNMV